MSLPSTTREWAEEADRLDPLSQLRNLFAPRRGTSVYLDHNSLGRPPLRAAAAIADGLDTWAERLVGAWTEWAELPIAVGDRLAPVVGAAPGSVVVCDSTTVNLYKLAAAALAARPDRTVVVAQGGDFPTDRYVLDGLARATGRRLRLVPSHPAEGMDLTHLAAAIDDRTALVCLSHVHYRSGATVDLAPVVAKAERVGALTLWDLSHSAGAVPVGLDEAGAHLAVGCTYKYLCGGPGAPAFLYVRPDLQGELVSPIHGWWGQRDQFAMGERYQPVDGVGRWLTGTPGVLGLLAAEAGIALVADTGIVALRARSVALVDWLAELVEARLVPLGVSLGGPGDPVRRGGHLALRHRQAWPLCERLVADGLVVGDFRGPDVLRLAPAPASTSFVEVFDAVERIASVLEAGDLPSHSEPGRIT